MAHATPPNHESVDKALDLELSINSGCYAIDALDVADAVLRSWAMVDIIEEFDRNQSAGASAGSDPSNR